MRVAVIGGGAAGMMCAATINESNSEIEVFIIEKNDSLGKKVIISGGGRCNITTGIEDIKAVIKKYPRGDKFIISAMHNFSSAAVRAWFEDHGIVLKCEKDLRVFPKSNQGGDVVKVFENIFAENKTKIFFKHSVQSIQKINNKFVIDFKNQAPLEVDLVVLSVGGQAYRKTGSVGDGYAIAESFGHHITQLAPSLFSFVVEEKWVGYLAGLSFINANIFVAGDKQKNITGPLLFTHTGITGPAVFAISALIAFEDFSIEKPLNILIDLIPDKKEEEIILILKKFIQENPKKVFKYSLHNFVPLVLAEIICNELNLEKRNADINKSELSQAVSWLKNIPLNIVGRGAGDEFVTAGGVDLREVNPKTMESLIISGLYFAGEILNVDGFTGGFNLQASWAMGHAAGVHISSLK